MKRALLPFILLCALTGCTSVKGLRNEMSQLRSSLFYELTSDQYEGFITDSIYMDFIDFSNIGYETELKRTGGFVVPLLLVNIQGESFRSTLGEKSLTQTYREFLTEAMLAECNSSTSLLLIDDKDNEHDPSTGYRLHLKIRANETTGKMRSRNFLLIIPSFDDAIEGYSFRPRPASTRLSITATLTQAGQLIFEKTYNVAHKQSGPRRSYDNSYDANQHTLDDMAESLSLATKEIVEQICQELHLLMEGRHLNGQ